MACRCFLSQVAKKMRVERDAMMDSGPAGGRALPAGAAALLTWWPKHPGICRGLVQRHGSLGGHHGLERALTPSSFSRFHLVNPSISSHPREDISPVPTTRCSFKMNLNLSASLNIFKLISRPSLCLPHATVGTFNDLPVPLDRLFSKPGRSVDIRAVVLDKDDCFAYPEESAVYDSYKVYLRAVCQSFLFVEHNPCSTSAFACRKSG